MSKNRINGFEQIKAFYSWVFNNPDKVRPTHVSLYLFLWNQNNRANWVEWFKCPYDLAMQGACIGNKGTYYRCLDELKDWNLIDYKKGINNYKAPQIMLIQLYKSEPLTGQVTVPLSEQVSEQLTEPLSGLLTVPIYKLVTENYKTINSKLEYWLSFEKDKSIKKFNFKKELLSLGVEEQILNDWLDVRKAKKARNTKTALTPILKEIEISGMSANDCIKICAERSWSGFKNEWLKNIDNGFKQNTKRGARATQNNDYEGFDY